MTIHLWVLFDLMYVCIFTILKFLFKGWNKFHSVFGGGGGGGATKAIPSCPAVLGYNQAFIIVAEMALKQDHLFTSS